MNKIVIISHYTHPIDWIFNIPICYKIYSNKQFENKGNEASCYIRYITDNYYNLPDKLLFIHDHQNSWHQDFPTDYIITNLNWELDSYFSINSRKVYQTISEDSSLEPSGYTWVKNQWFLFEKYLQLPKQLVFYSCAQFCVNRELILQYPLNYYMDLLHWLTHTSLDNYISSRIFEYVWHYFFTKNPTERIHNSIFI